MDTPTAAMQTHPDTMDHDGHRHEVTHELRSLLHKVKQAESALEAQERQAAADWRQLKASWKSGWTPARIVIAGLVSGFRSARSNRSSASSSGSGALQLVSALAGLFAGGSAQAAAGEAAHAADTAQQTAAVVAPDAALAAAQPPSRTRPNRPARGGHAMSDRSRGAGHGQPITPPLLDRRHDRPPAPSCCRHRARGRARRAR